MSLVRYFRYQIERVSDFSRTDAGSASEPVEGNVCTYSTDEPKIMRRLCMKTDQVSGEEMIFSKSLNYLKLIFTVILGGITVFLLLMSLQFIRTPVLAAPLAKPLKTIISNTTSISHTNATTHEMVVLPNGKITNRFYNIYFNGNTPHRVNQINQPGSNPDMPLQ